LVVPEIGGEVSGQQGHRLKGFWRKPMCAHIA
jgi:hypothetical protein